MTGKIDLEQRRKELGLTLEDVGKFVGVSKSTVKKWETGYIDNMKRDKIALLSQILKVSPLAILGIEPTEKDREKKGVKIPVLGSIPAGIPIEAIEDVIDYEEIPESWTRGGNEYFALKIKGESMMPEYRDKDTVIFKKQNTCDNNDDCAVMVNGNEATFKRVERLMEGVILKPLNPAFESKFYSNKEIEELPVRVIGVFWELRRGRAVK